MVVLVINLIYCDLPNAKAVDHHVNLVERMVRMSQIEDGDLNGIDFYHHII